MFLALWNYLKGYVMIRVSGFSVERFVNLAALKGIYIWDVCPDRSGITMKVSIKGFRMLKECGRKTHCHFKILKRCGLPFVMHKYEKRKILGGGIFLFIIGLYILSSMIWVVDITGNDRINKQAILDSCKELGLKPGSFKFKINTKKISDGLIDSFEEISWVGVQMKGTNIKISVVETIPKTDIVDRTTPCDVVAKKDSIVTAIVASSGTPLVKMKDVVKAGDVLVSAEVLIKDGDLEVGKEYVRAKAEVRGKTWENIEQELPLRFEEKVFTGEEKSDLSLTLGDKNLNFVQPNIKYENYDTIEVYDKPFSIGDYRFPISIKKEAYKQYDLVERTRTPEKAKEELKKTIETKANELVSAYGSILNIDISFEETEEKIIAKAVITLEERIDEQKERVVEEEIPPTSLEP